MKKTQYYMYGILISYKKYLETSTNLTINDVLNESEDIQGIFTGRQGDFIIIGKVLKIIEEKNLEPIIIIKLALHQELTIKNIVKNNYGFDGEFNYYFIKK